MSPLRFLQRGDHAPPTARFHGGRSEKQVVFEGAGSRLIRFLGNHRVTFGRYALQNKTYKAVAIAVVDALVDLDIVVVLIIRLLQVVDDGLGLLCQLLWQEIWRCGFHASEFDRNRVNE